MKEKEKKVTGEEIPQTRGNGDNASAAKGFSGGGGKEVDSEVKGREFNESAVGENTDGEVGSGKKKSTVALPAEEDERKRFIAALVKETEEDFNRRRMARLPYERQWELNMNYLKGNQYCDVNMRGEIECEEREYFWQNREVFNHIAPITETRLARFSRISPVISVRPASDDDEDVSGAALAEKLISAAFEKADVSGAVKRATVWSETCGSGFYKVLWNENGGAKVGEADGNDIYEGEISVSAVSPFEIFPDNLFADGFAGCASVIHARAMTVSEIKRVYGEVVAGGDTDVYTLNFTAATSGAGAVANGYSGNKSALGIGAKEGSYLSDSAVVIEKFERPSDEFPCGRVITVAGGKLLYYGELPYLNGVAGSRTFPFVKQDGISSAGNFFGTSVVERLIPVQRAYNAVKNRKHEFINRLSMGVMTVEDGSVDVEDLEREGVPPGKILVYRQGATAPEMMKEFSMPADFKDEEEKLLAEFVVISGVSDVSSSARSNMVSSGTALEILVEQDNERMLLPAEEIRKSYIGIARFIVRLYAQFSAGIRRIRYSDSSERTKVLYADGSALSSDEVYIENENELLYSQSAKKDTVLKLYESGLLADDGGVIRPATKEKVLALLGYKDLDYGKGIPRLHEEKAQKENKILVKKAIGTDEVDDDEVHIDEHVRYVLCEYDDLEEGARERIYEHIKLHREKIAAKNAAGKGEAAIAAGN